MEELNKFDEIIPEREESTEDKIFGIKAEIDQMIRMVEENINKIAEGDDVIGRTFLKEHLEKEIENKRAELAQLQGNE